jgi:hypothetical protein
MTLFETIGGNAPYFGSSKKSVGKISLKITD